MLKGVNLAVSQSNRPCIISGQDARTTRNFWVFFKLEVSKVNWGYFQIFSHQKTTFAIRQGIHSLAGYGSCGRQL